MPEVVVLDDADALAAEVALRFTAFLAEVQATGREPHVVLTGGTIANAAYELIDAAPAPPPGVDWSRVHLWWGDERFVPAGHDDRNDAQARAAFIDRVGVPADHVHSMPAHGCGESMADAADGYGATLPDQPFDLVLYGVGPDGHVASLFPGFDQLDETDRACVEVFGSPKPPPERITLTHPRLNDTHEAWLLVSGDGKADAVAQALGGADRHQVPAAGVTALDQVVWLVDAAAASRLRR